MRSSHRLDHFQAPINPDDYREGDPRCACLGAGCDVCLAWDYEDRRRDGRVYYERIDEGTRR